jgi:hypothetical protein
MIISGGMKYLAMAILVGGFIGIGAYVVHLQRDVARESRWHVLQQREFLGTLTADEKGELGALNQWAEARGERLKP